MIGGQRVRINVRDPAQEDPDTVTEAEAQVDGSTEGHQQEQPQEVNPHSYSGHSSDWHAGPVYLRCSCYTSSSSWTSQDTQGPHSYVS
jgi:hypothetical protein